MNIVSSWKSFQKTLEEYRLNLPCHVDLIQANLGNKKNSFPLSCPYASVAKEYCSNKNIHWRKFFLFTMVVH